MVSCNNCGLVEDEAVILISKLRPGEAPRTLMPPAVVLEQQATCSDTLLLSDLYLCAPRLYSQDFCYHHLQLFVYCCVYYVVTMATDTKFSLLNIHFFRTFKTLVNELVCVHIREDTCIHLRACIPSL